MSDIEKLHEASIANQQARLGARRLAEVVWQGSCGTCRILIERGDQELGAPCSHTLVTRVEDLVVCMACGARQPAPGARRGKSSTRGRGKGRND